MEMKSSGNNAIKELFDDLFTSRDGGRLDTRQLILASRIRLVFVFPLMCVFIYTYLVYFPIRKWPVHIESWLFNLIAITIVAYLIANCTVNYLTKWSRLVERINYLTLLLELAIIQMLWLWGGFLAFPVVLLMITVVIIYRIGMDYYTALLTAVLGVIMYIVTVLMEVNGLLPQHPGIAGSYNKTEAALISISVVLISVFLAFIVTNLVMNQKFKLNRQLEEQSTRDGLTGIPNRRYFNEHLDIEWRRAMRSSKPLSLIMVDIDNFKAYNDTYGHLNGDECLRKVAVCLHKGARRPADVVARFGGEEFVVLLPETTLDGAASLAENLRRRVEMLDIPHKQSSLHGKITISLGVASLIPSPALSPDDLLEHADKALYRAKHLGRNRVSVDFALLYPQHN